MKRIAIASLDGATISSHLGRSQCFLVYETDGGEPVRKEVRNNSYTCTPESCCGHKENHSHAGLVALLQDCEAVIAGGMGERAAQELRQNGVMPLTAPVDVTPDEVAKLYFSDDACCGDHTCTCSH